MQQSLQSEINVTPLVDVALVLLITFFVVTPLMVDPVPLPSAKNPDAIAESTSQLQLIVRDGLVVVGAKVVRPEEVATALAAEFAEKGERPVVIRGDRSLRYGQMLEVMKACRAEGFRDIGLLVRREDIRVG